MGFRAGTTTALAVRNRTFLAPRSPIALDSAVTSAGQTEIITDALARYESGMMLPHEIVRDDGVIVGRINLNGITRGAFQSASVGYGVGQTHTCRGVAMSALRSVVRVAFTELGLHRVQGETLLHNHASRRVLERVGFRQVGVAPQLRRIAGTWQDHAIYHLVNEAWVAPPQ